MFADVSSLKSCKAFATKDESSENNLANYKWPGGGDA